MCIQLLLKESRYNEKDCEEEKVSDNCTLEKKLHKIVFQEN